MSVKVFFADFENGIREIFERAKAEAGDAAQHIRLELTDQARGLGQARADIYALPDGTVRITWCAIATLWAATRSAAQILIRAEAGRKGGKERLALPEDPALRVAMDLFILCRRLYLDDFPQAKWVEWAPKPQVSPRDSDAQAGNNLFEGALAWMIRHEIAHFVCRHNEREKSEALTTAAMEREADRQATEWFRRGLRADPTREPGTRPGKDERELEFRGLAMGLGLIWVAMFEASIAQRNAGYPPPADRLYTCLNQLSLREDSAAAQWLAEIIHAWIDPEGNWAAAEGHKDAQAFFSEAVYRLQRYIVDPSSAPGIQI